jgi:hypothetical protein
LRRISAEGLEIERLERADEPEAETPEDLDKDEEPDVARKAQLVPTVGSAYPSTGTLTEWSRRRGAGSSCTRGRVE